MSRVTLGEPGLPMVSLKNLNLRRLHVILHDDQPGN